MINRTYSIHGEHKMYKKFCLTNIEDSGVNGKIILKYTSEKQGVKTEVE